MITLEIYPESKKVLLSFPYVCFTFASDMDHAKHDKRVNKKSFCQTVFLECRKSTHQDQLCVMDLFTHVKLVRFFFIQAKYQPCRSINHGKFSKYAKFH